MISKTIIQTSFESGRVSFAFCRDLKTSKFHELLLASDDGETVFARKNSDSIINDFYRVSKKKFFSRAAGFPHEIDMKSVAAVWPIQVDRATKFGQIHEVAEFCEENEDAPGGGVIGLGVLMMNGTFNIVGAAAAEHDDEKNDNDNDDDDDDYNSGEMFEILKEVEIFEEAASPSVAVVDTSVLQISDETVVAKLKPGSCTCMAATLVKLNDNQKILTVFDGDTGKLILKNLLSSSAKSQREFSPTCIATSYPFVVALDSSNGKIAVWEMLMM